MKKRAETFKKIYEKFGLREASKMSGIKTYDIIRYSNISFGVKDAYILLMDMMSDGLLPKQYKGYELYYDFLSATLYWEKNNQGSFYQIVVMATPFWNGTKEIPIDIQVIYWMNKEKSESYEDDFSKVIELGDIVFNNIEELLVWFRDFYLPETYNVIKSTIKD